MTSVLGHAILACGAGGATTQAAAGGGATGFSLPGIGMSGLLMSSIGLVVLGLAAAAVLMFALRPRAGTLAAIPVGARVSPDGHYWWDGAAWRPVRQPF